MTDHSAVDAALAAYENAVASDAQNSASSLAALQLQLVSVQTDDTAKTSALTAAQAQISVLQQELAALQPVPVVTAFKDFAIQYSGIFTNGKSLTGPGASKLTYEMTPNSSTKAAYANALTSGQTNLLHLIRTGGLNSSSVVTGLDVSGFTLLGTDQGSLYNGIQVGYSTGAHIHDLIIKSIPGTTSSPPGETFSLSLWHAISALIENVTIDGRDVNGKPAASSLIALNSLSDCTINNVAANYSLNAFGMAIWDSYNVTVTNANLSKNRAPLNIEQPHAGTMHFKDCDMRGQTLPSHPLITCNGNIASTTLIIEDPLVDVWPIKVGVSSLPYSGAPQLQKISDVHLILNGVDVSNDKTKLNCGQVW